MKLIELLQEGITHDIYDLKWAFIHSGTHDYYKIIKILGELRIHTLSPRSQKQIIHILTSYKEQLIRAILLKMRGDPSMIMSQTYLNEAVPKMIRLGLDWPELKIIQTSLNAELKRKLTEEIVNDSSYGGWIDSKNKKIIYVQHQNHIGVARKLGATGADPYIWMYDRGYVRFITEYSPDNSLAIQGKLEDIKATFAMWWPQARRCETLYVDNIDDHSSKSFFMKFDPQDRAKAQKLYGPPSTGLHEEVIKDQIYGGWIDAREKKIHYVSADADEGNAHSELARNLGAPASRIYDWMFENNYVRFVNEYGYRSSLSLEGMFDDIKNTFKMWWPQARKVDDLYIDIVKGRSLHFTVNSDSASRIEAQKLFGPPAGLS